MAARTLLCVLALLLTTATRAQPPQTDPGQSQVPQDTTPQEKVAAEPGSRADAEDLDLLVIEENIVKYTNQQRAKYGLAVLEIDGELMESAREHASWMALHRRLVHTSRPVAENIAMGQPDSRSVVADWMNSAGHRANILNRGYRRIGVAAYRTPAGTIYWCQQFLR